ncbi:MAG: ParB/RepB/Spo0J family partition protein [Pseudomonadota bacterium]|nr:ParB/RepB/Spo0J family partition protein [Pseudomonadota bacterium]
MQDKRKALGRSLDDLGISDLLLGIDSPEGQEVDRLKAIHVPVNSVKPNPYQPRKHFSASALEQLAQSIKSQGLLQPIVVRDMGSGGFQLIAGERRLRASQIAGLKQIPAIVKNLTDQACLVLAVIENIQRQDLNVVELAESFQALATKYGMTHAEVGRLVGRSRAAVSNLIRLLQLDEQVKNMLVKGFIEMGHARCLLGLPKEKQLETAEKIVEQQLPVRETESIVRALVQADGKEQPARMLKSPLSPSLQAMKDSIVKIFGIKTTIKPKPNSQGGVVSFPYANEEELQKVIARFS